jgi:MFS family permease
LPGSFLFTLPCRETAECEGTRRANHFSFCAGSFVNGIDTGIISSTLAQKSFKLYMYGESLNNTNIKGGITSGYYAGYAVGSAIAAYTMDRISRRWTLFLGSIFSVIGAVLQTAAVNPAMLIVGRAVSGFSIGMVYPTAPVYLAELSAPENRGFLVGLKGLLNTFGFFAANWIGYAGSFAHGDAQWRIPLAMQMPPALLLGILTLFLPYSPRWCKSLYFISFSRLPSP